MPLLNQCRRNKTGGLSIESIHQIRSRAQGCDAVVIPAQALPVDNFLDVYLRCRFHPACQLSLCIRNDSNVWG